MAQRILIVGTGFAGMWSALSAARALDMQGEGADLEIVTVSPAPELHLRPRFYEADPGSMRVPLLELFEAVGVRHVQGLVEDIDADAQEVTIRGRSGPNVMHYDRLILASGSQLYRPDIPGLTEYGFSVDQIGEAEALERHLASLARRPDTLARNTVVVAGGGFTGIETAAEMPARLRATLPGTAEIRVIIVERASTVGPDLGAGPRPVIEEALRELGVECKLGVAVAAIDGSGLTTSAGERIETMTTIWTAGLRASPLTAHFALPRDTTGRLHVDRDLRVMGCKNIFATGDVAFAATDEDGNHAMMSCQHAMNLGRSAGYNAAACLLGLPTIPYSQPAYVTCLDLGPWGAVYTEGWDREVKLQGAEAKALKHMINTQIIYPPPPERKAALAAADPLRLLIA